MAQPLLAAISNNLENEAKAQDDAWTTLMQCYLTLSDKAMDGSVVNVQTSANELLSPGWYQILLPFINSVGS